VDDKETGIELPWAEIFIFQYRPAVLSGWRRSHIILAWNVH